MSEITLNNGDTEKIIPSDQANQAYIMEVYDSDVRIGHSQRYAREGTTLEAGLNHRIDNLRGEQLFAHAHDGSARVRLTHAAANVESNPSREVSVIEGDIQASNPSHDSFGTQTVTGTGDFSAEIVPQGVEVVYRADPSNDGTVYLSGFPLTPGDWVNLSVSSVGEVSVTADVSSDETHAIYEVSA